MAPPTQQLNRSGSVSTTNNVSNVSETSPKARLSINPSNVSFNPNLANQGGKTDTPQNTPVTVLKKSDSKPIRVISRIIFVKMGQIDTRNERYDAEAYIECMWEDDAIFKYLSSPNLDKEANGNGNKISLLNQQSKSSSSASATNLINVKNIINNLNYLEYDPNFFWSPQLYIENAIGDLKEEIRYKLEIVEKEGSNLASDASSNKLQNLSNNLTIRVTEMRKVRGIFYERLELYDFPMDIQEISITLTSKRSISEVEIIENPKDPSSINIEDFLDQQEWDLFDFVKPGSKLIQDPWRKYERSAILAKSYISRKPGYYLYNAYMLIFLITTLGFVPFAFEPNGPQFRCQVTGLLILTSVNFRWIVTQRLPSVPYLTSLDKYAIGNLLHLVIFCVWHSIIGSDSLASDAPSRKRFDCYFLYGSSTFFIFYNISCLCWFLKMSRSIKKFLDDGQAEAKKLAEERALAAMKLSQQEEEEESPSQANEPSTNYNNRTNNNNTNNNNNKNNNNTNNNNNINNISNSNNNLNNNANNSYKRNNNNAPIQRGNQGSNNSNSSRGSGNQQQAQAKSMMVSTSPQSKINTNVSQPEKSPSMAPKMGCINEEKQRLMRINSIGMNNMIKVNQNLKTGV